MPCNHATRHRPSRRRCAPSRTEDEADDEDAPPHPCGVDPNTVELDTAALTDRIEMEINPAREHLMEMAAAHPYVTRLYSTMSPEEMTLDPEFTFNGDLGDVSNVRTIEVEIPCDGDFPDEGAATLVNAAGMAVEADLSGDSAVVRMDGATVQGMDTPAAAVIERPMAAGPSEVIGMMGQMMGTGAGTGTGTGVGTGTGTDTDTGAMPTDPMGSAGVSPNDDAGGCYGCSNQNGHTHAWAFLALLCLGLRRRR